MKKELNLGVLFTGKVDATFLNAIKNIQSKLDSLDNSSKKAATGTTQFTNSVTKTIPVLGQYLAQLEKILKAQTVWYGSKAILFAAVELPMSAITSVTQYGLELDKARAEMLRWGATGGQVTKQMEADADSLMLTMRRTLLQYPLELKDLSKSVQAFIGAGVPVTTVEQMIPMIAKMKTAFKEIDFEQFAVAVTGAFNTFRDQIKLGRDDAEKFQIVMEQLLRAQAVGVIRPEQFTKVLQYLGQVSDLAGFSTEQMFAMATAITNTGNQAANASRLMAGLMQAMSGPKFRKALEGDLGLKLDRNVSLAKQFDSIMTTIIDKMGKGQEIPLGWLQS
jgi:TP901 family phage tail tape measure protein